MVLLFMFICLRDIHVYHISIVIIITIIIQMITIMKLSSRLQAAGERFTNIRVLAVPPKESCISCVSSWFL